MRFALTRVSFTLRCSICLASYWSAVHKWPDHPRTTDCRGDINQPRREEITPYGWLVRRKLPAAMRDQQRMGQRTTRGDASLGRRLARAVGVDAARACAAAVTWSCPRPDRQAPHRQIAPAAKIEQPRLAGRRAGDGMAQSGAARSACRPPRGNVSARRWAGTPGQPTRPMSFALGNACREPGGRVSVQPNGGGSAPTAKRLDRCRRARVPTGYPTQGWMRGGQHCFG